MTWCVDGRYSSRTDAEHMTEFYVENGATAAHVVEHHAAKAQSGIRDLAPYGSSLWLRWPELGLKLVPVAGIGADENTLRIDGDEI